MVRVSIRSSTSSAVQDITCAVSITTALSRSVGSDGTSAHSPKNSSAVETRSSIWMPELAVLNIFTRPESSRYSREAGRVGS